MSKIETGGAAFPHDDRAVFMGRSGMTLRDYFAAKAMSSLIPMTHDELQDFTCDYDASDTIKLIAEACYTIADVMLQARETA